MPTLKDLIGPNGLQCATRIDRSEVRLLWHSSYWDGPRSGMLLFRGEECWFEVVEENEDAAADWYRRFAVVRLSPEQHAEEQQWHDLFRRCVGSHTDYDESRQRSVGALHPREKWSEFYDAYKLRIPRDYTGNEVLGWFEWL